MDLDRIVEKTLLQPRPYQYRIVTKVVDMYQGRHIGANGQVKNASKSVMIESPTGSGKTSMALLAAKALQSEIPELVVGWVAMRRNLLQQAEAENRDKEINVENIQFISMFENKPKLVEQRVDKKLLLIVDECLAGETLVHTLVDGEEVLVPISDIVDNGIGSHVLSYNLESKEVEWKEIVSRTCTGERPVFEVEIELENGWTTKVVATDNHRFFADGEYKRVDELVVGQEVIVKS